MEPMSTCVALDIARTGQEAAGNPKSKSGRNDPVLNAKCEPAETAWEVVPHRQWCFCVFTIWARKLGVTGIQARRKVRHFFVLFFTKSQESLTDSLQTVWFSVLSEGKLIWEFHMFLAKYVQTNIVLRERGYYYLLSKIFKDVGEESFFFLIWKEHFYEIN